MGAYLSQPNITKSSSDGGNSNLSYGISAMQGWRVSMEDAHNCILDFDEDTAMFAVYDGHGGEEVALYCSKYLPDIIKEQKTYKDRKLQKALEDAFLAIDSRITTEEVIKELVQIAGRPTEEPPSEKMAEEDDLETEEAALLHEEATMTIEELLARYGQNLNAVKHAAAISTEGEYNIHIRIYNIQIVLAGVMFIVQSDSSRQERSAIPLLHTARVEQPLTEGGDMKLFQCCCTTLHFKSRITFLFTLPQPGSDSGTTAVVALIRGKQLIVANAGDSRCVVSERGKAVDMSYDHKPEDEVELARIKNAGGKVTMDGRVNGGLNLSRAIGDHFYKRNRALPPEEQMISAMPDVKVLTLNEDHDFMVIACDGIWNVLSSQEVVDFISERIKPNESGHVRSLSSIIEELLDHCLAPDTSGDGTGCDNMTCVIITLRPHPSATNSEDTKKRKHQEEAGVTEEPEENGNDSKKAKSD
uniref:Protein phosphatase 1G n=1 Tax=Takifugu rubripes TaxID=31033 RepID=A0A674M8T3_TAKRU